MFREMRRNKQQLSRAECEEILRRATSGVLAVSGDDGYPYAVPLSYVYEGGKLWFHCALSGHKLDAIRRDSRVSFCVTGQDEVVPAAYTTYFWSVILFGQARILDNPEEKLAALEKLAERYAPGDAEGRAKEIEKSFSRTCIVEIAVEHMTGKAAIELVREK